MHGRPGYFAGICWNHSVDLYPDCGKNVEFSHLLSSFVAATDCRLLFLGLLSLSKCFFSWWFSAFECISVVSKELMGTFFRCDSISQHLPLSVCESVGKWVIVSDLEIAIASPSFAILLSVLFCYLYFSWNGRSIAAGAIVRKG